MDRRNSSRHFAYCALRDRVSSGAIMLESNIVKSAFCVVFFAAATASAADDDLLAEAGIASVSAFEDYCVRAGADFDEVGHLQKP